MVDTAVRPRPDFTTFLLSDENTEGNGLSYYNQKKLARSQKVALLQQKRAMAQVPGCKPVYQQYEKILLKNPQDEFIPGIKPAADAETQTTAAHALQQKKAVEFLTDQENTDKETSSIILHSPQTTLRSTTTCRERSLQRGKSATFRSLSERHSREGGTQRPKTASDVDKLWKLQASSPVAAQAEFYHNDIEDSPPTTVATPQQPPHQLHEEVNIDSLVKSYTWTSSTKRAHNEVGWENKLSEALSPSQIMNLKIAPPDPVSFRFCIKRNELYPQHWQCLGGTWDIIQSRSTSLYRRPSDRNTFCSPFRNNCQIPGYQGCTPGKNHVDYAEGKFEPLTNVYSHQPRPSKISRRPNIPGYTGCTLLSNGQPAHANMGYPRVTTHTRTYCQHTVDENISPFIRKSVLSKVISLNAPYNPYNKIEPVH